MNDKNTRKKGIGWFSGFNSNQEQFEEDDINQQLSQTKNKVEDKIKSINRSKETDSTGDIDNNEILFSRDNQDKVVLDLIVSLENMIKDRQLLLYKSNDLEAQLLTANDNIHRMKQDIRNKDQLLLEKNKEIGGLEASLTSRQMTYDQLLEDYKEYQNTSTIEYENISNQLDKEVNKYANLNEELISSKHKNMLKVSGLEEDIRNLVIENQQYEQQYNKVVEEKAQLMKTITDFTNQMSFSFSPNASNNSNDSK